MSFTYIYQECYSAPTHFLVNTASPQGDVGVISSIISQVIRIHKDEHCHGHTSNESLSLGDDQSQDDVEHGYYDEDDCRCNKPRVCCPTVHRHEIKVETPAQARD